MGSGSRQALDHLADRFDGDLHLVLAAYHMGPTRVGRVLGDNPGITGEQLVEQHANPTTRRYVRRVIGGAAEGRGQWSVANVLGTVVGPIASCHVANAHTFLGGKRPVMK